MVFLNAGVHVVKDAAREASQSFFELLEVVLANGAQVEGQTQVVAAAGGAEGVEDEVLDAVGVELGLNLHAHLVHDNFAFATRVVFHEKGSVGSRSLLHHFQILNCFA